MSADEPERIEPAPPRETAVLFGHAYAEQALLAAYQGARFPHAWLIAGPAGIGKATLAYRMARFMLALPDPRAPQVQSAKSLHVDSDHPVARRIIGRADFPSLPVKIYRCITVLMASVCSAIIIYTNNK